VLIDVLPDIQVTPGAAMIRSNFVKGYKRLPVRFNRGLGS